MESRREEGQTDKHGLYQRKGSDRVLTTCTRDVLYVQFYAHAICDVETRIPGRRRKRDFIATDRDGSGFGD